MITISRPDAPETPRAQPCYDVNPALWTYFCHQANRDPIPSHVWTEADVVQWLDTDPAHRANAAYRMLDGILHMSERAGRSSY